MEHSFHRSGRYAPCRDPGVPDELAAVRSFPRDLRGVPRAHDEPPVFSLGGFSRRESGALLPRVNLPNTLTFGRLSSIPTMLFLIIQASLYPIMPVILPFMCLVFATDFIDGTVARKRNQITFVGRYLDSSSDYLMIVAVSIIFYYYSLVPLWFFILILCRLVLFSLGMVLLALREGKAYPLSTFLGKASIFALMVLYVMKIAGLFGVPWIGNDIVVRCFEYAVALIVVASLVDKAIFPQAHVYEVRRAPAGKPDRPTLSVIPARSAPRHRSEP